MHTLTKRQLLGLKMCFLYSQSEGLWGLKEKAVANLT